VVVVESQPWDESAMQTLSVTEKTGSDGILHLRIPVGQPEAEYEAVVVLQPKIGVHTPDTRESRGWPSGYFERTFGSITDETFLRPRKVSCRRLSNSNDVPARQ